MSKDDGERIDLAIGLVGDDHVLSLLNIQTDEELLMKFNTTVPEEWANVIQFKIRNYGVVGDGTTDLLKQLDGKLFEQISGLDYAIIIIGSNDVLLGTPLPEIVENLKRILSMIGDTAATPIFCTLLPVSREKYVQAITDINSIMTIFCAKNNIPVVDINIVFHDGRDRLDNFYDLGDGIHLTQEGYITLADTLMFGVQDVIIREFASYIQDNDL